MKGFKKSALVRSLSSTSSSSSPAPTPVSEAPTSPQIPEEVVASPEPIPVSPSAEAPKKEKKSKSSKEPPPPPPPDPIRTEEYVIAAEERIAEIERVLSDVRLKKAKMTNEIARKIFSAVGSAMPVLEAVASLHPISDNVFKVFQGVFELENMRQEHDENITDVFYSATVAMWSLHNLAKLTIEVDMKPKFESILQKVQKTLEDFSQYIFKYYSQNKAVRLVTIHGANNALEAFKAEFDSQKSELQWFVDTHTAVSTQRSLITSGGKIDKLLNKASEHSETLKTVAENARKATEQYGQMQLSLGNMLTSIRQSQFESRDAILKRLDEGPHELIRDQALKLVWKDMRWRNTIKSRHFLDAVQDSFFQKFATSLKNTSNLHQDQWTLDILSKSIFYPGVGDAIDGDSSGFVSVTELNDFLAMRPDRWSLPEWLAFWAVGWSQTNMTYRVKIHDKWHDITEKTSSLVASSGEDHALTRFVTETESFIKNIVGVAEEDFEEEFLSVSTEAELHRLNTKYRRYQEENLGEQLENNIITDADAVFAIVGGKHQRIELSVLPLIYMWLSSFVTKFDAATGEDAIAALVHEYNVGRKTIENMFSRRLAELVQIWHQQKEHLPTQVSGFCGGIFETYYVNVFEKARAEKKANKMRTYRA